MLAYPGENINCSIFAFHSIASSSLNFRWNSILPHFFLFVLIRAFDDCAMVHIYLYSFSGARNAKQTKTRETGKNDIVVGT